MAAICTFRLQSEQLLAAFCTGLLAAICTAPGCILYRAPGCNLYRHRLAFRNVLDVDGYDDDAARTYSVPSLHVAYVKDLFHVAYMEQILHIHVEAQINEYNGGKLQHLSLANKASYAGFDYY